MSDSVLILVCAVVASLASGVLIAYGVCVAMFRIFTVRVQQAALESQHQVVISSPNTVTPRIAEG